MRGKTLIPQDVQLNLEYNGEDTVSFKLEAPTKGSNASLKKGFRKRVIREGYYSPKGYYVNPVCDYYFIAELRYDWHRMNLPALWTADVITNLEVPPDFLYGGHEQFNCILDPSMTEIWRTWMEDMVVGFETDHPGNPANQMPQGPVTLRFFGTDPMTAEQVRASVWDQPISLSADGETLNGIVAYRHKEGDETIEAWAINPAAFGEETTETYEYGGQEFTIKFIETEHL